jgi:multisubunit Na+/H+ antiporter MnhE subunit
VHLKVGEVQGRVLKAIVFSTIEFLFLLGLWMLFVSQMERAEFIAGICAAALGAVGDGIVKSKRFAKFRPRPQWLWLFSWEPWYVLDGSAAIFWALAKRFLGKESEAQFRVVPFRAGEHDSESAGRRALAITLTTIPPNFIVIGIDMERSFMLVHQVSPTGTPRVTKKLGATG